MTRGDTRASCQEKSQQSPVTAQHRGGEPGRRPGSHLHPDRPARRRPRRRRTRLRPCGDGRPVDAATRRQRHRRAWRSPYEQRSRGPAAARHPTLTTLPLPTPEPMQKASSGDGRQAGQRVCAGHHQVHRGDLDGQEGRHRIAGRRAGARLPGPVMRCLPVVTRNGPGGRPRPSGGRHRGRQLNRDTRLRTLQVIALIRSGNTPQPTRTYQEKGRIR